MNDLQKLDIKLPSIPKNLWEKHEARLLEYKSQRENIHAFIKDNLKKSTDYGKTEENAKKDTLMKSGADKINDFMMCRVKLYPDIETWKMWGSRSGTVCYVGYIIDHELLGLVLSYLHEVGIENEQAVVRLFAWGEGRGAYEEMEKTYSSSAGKLAGKPLKGTMNRAVKIAEKRTIVDATIRTFGLDFTQDEEYGKDGKLKGDNTTRQKKSQKNTSDLPAENFSVYSSCLTLLQEKYKGYRLFSQQDMIARKKNLEAVKLQLDKLVDFYEVLKRISTDTKKKIDTSEG